FKDLNMIHRIIYAIVGICGVINIGIYFMNFEDR
ncbi:MAG: DUF378 domain-containing protein, partial [Bacilli bacterium]|nr:DUF378 domain-containing protein [Bacilli bacterium]